MKESLKMLNLLECTPIAQFAIGLDHRVIFWNKACEKLTGLKAEDMIGTDQQWKAFYSKKRPVLADLSVEQDFKRFMMIYEGKNPAKSEIVPYAWEATDFFDDMNGKARYIYFLAAPIFNDSGIMIGAVTTLQDITEQKLWEMSLEKESRHLAQQNLKFRSSMNERYMFCNIIGKSSKMQEIYDLILKASSSSANVIVYGESGTGKELVARAVHEMSDRHDKVFLPVNCGAIPENLLESEFFGHAKGSFTGAHANQPGFLDQVDGGTLFLDEVGELALGMQVKLLRAIEGGGYSAVGSREIKTSDFRIIAATNRDLKEEIRKGSMRKDFFYRIHVIPVHVPPLRERKEDLPLIVDHFLKNSGVDNNISSVPGKVLEALYSYNWPGNVRELQNVLHRYLTLNYLDMAGAVNGELGPEMGENPEINTQVSPNGSTVEIQGLTGAVEQFETHQISRILEKYRWNRTEAASALGVSRKTLFRKMKKYGL